METLQPPNLDWQVAVARAAAGFFTIDVGHRKEYTFAIGKVYDESLILPFSVADFLQYLGTIGISDAWPQSSTVVLIIHRMRDAGILLHSGSSGGFLEERYFLRRSITRMQVEGDLWLTPILGPQLLIERVRSSVVHLTGFNEKNDVVAGSGLRLTATSILTAAHVVSDMDISDVKPLTIAGGGHLLDMKINNSLDVAVVEFSDLPNDLTEGICARDPEWTEPITTFGYPQVSGAACAPLIVHRGEVVNPHLTFQDDSRCFLFSALTRPGNSGGPIFADDGRLVGIVSRETYFRDTTALPFFVGVPTSTIAFALEDLVDQTPLKVEEWQPGN